MKLAALPWSNRKRRDKKRRRWKRPQSTSIGSLNQRKMASLDSLLPSPFPSSLLFLHPSFSPPPQYYFTIASLSAAVCSLLEVAENLPKEQLPSHFEKVNSECQILRKYLSDSSLFLSKYVLKLAQEVSCYCFIIKTLSYDSYLSLPPPSPPPSLSNLLIF